MTDRNATDRDRPDHDATDRAHETVLSFPYAETRRARVVANALVPEMGELDESRSAATVSREDGVVRVRVAAADLAALRAGITSWSRLVAVAERVTDCRVPERG